MTRICPLSYSIKNANIKPTLNCCVIARNGITYGNIKRTEKLKDVYSTKKFLLNLFKIGYQRRKMELSSSQNGCITLCSA